MLSKYFEIKTQSEEFKTELNKTLDFCKDKKVLIYGAGEGFLALNKIYNFKENLNIVAIADKKFEKTNCQEFEGIKTVSPIEITDIEFDIVLISNEGTAKIIDYLTEDLDIDKEKIKTIFVEEIKDETKNLNYLYKFNFDKTLPKLIKKLKNKTVVLYGAGAFLELIKKYFDISQLNVIGIADRRFEYKEANEEFLGYKAYSPYEIKDLNPDYVLVATKFYINIIEDMYYNTLKDTKIKIKPLMKKSFWTLVKEIWG